MAPRYLVTLKGEFEEIQAVVAEIEEPAREKALRLRYFAHSLVGRAAAAV